MPVWHERTAALREADELKVIGVVQEQHPDRALLYSSWKEYDWPILWDPFNTTESAVVPIPVLIDEHGIVRKVGARPDDLEAFLAASFEAPEALPAVEQPGENCLPVLGGERPSIVEEDARKSMDALLWGEGAATRIEGDPVKTLVAIAESHPEDARAQFRAGVALRMRFDGVAPSGNSATADSALGDPEAPREARVGTATDFQAALDRWSAGLKRQPNQYIWRRRIQQYGPRLDKPYPFYTWVDEAVAALRERGIEVPALVAELTPAELMEPRRSDDAPAEAEEPDPEGQITRDDGLVRARHAVAFHTGRERNNAMVHLSLEVSSAREAHWNNEVEPTRIWLDHESLPEGAAIDARLLTGELPTAELSSEARRFSFEVTLPAAADELSVRGYALFHVCEGIDGTCVYRRLDFTIPVQRR